MPSVDELLDEYNKLLSDKQYRQQKHPIYGMKRIWVIGLQLHAYFRRAEPNIDPRITPQMRKTLESFKKKIKNKNTPILLGAIRDRKSIAKNSALYNELNYICTYISHPEMSARWLAVNEKKLSKSKSTVGGLSVKDMISLKYIEYIFANGLAVDGSNHLDFVEDYFYYIDSDPAKIKRLKQLAQTPSLLKHFGIEDAVNSIVEAHDNNIKNSIEEITIAINKVTSNSEYANKLDIGGLTKYQIAGLRLLNLVHPENPNSAEIVGLLSKEQIDFMNKFIKYSMGNMELNSKLNYVLEYKNLEEELSNKYGYGVIYSIGDLATFTYKTRKCEKYNSIADKFITNINSKVSGFFKSFRTKKITLSEYGILSDVDKVRNILPESVYSKDLELNSIFKKAELIHHTAASFKTSFQDNLAKKHSMISTVNMSKYANLQRKELTLMQKLRQWITKHDHTSIIYRKGDNNDLTQSHLNYHVEENSFRYGEYLYSDIYKINLANLVDNKTKQILKSQLGDDWEDKLNQKFSKIERAIHDNAINKFDRMQVPTARGFRIRGILSKFKFKKSLQTDFEKIRQNMLGTAYKSTSGNSKKAEMLCSQFAANVIIASIMELNHQLGSPTDKKDRYIKVPFGKNEDLRYLTPDRLISQLNKYNAIEKVEPDPLLSYFVKT